MKIIIKALRCHQWIKNILIFVPLVSSHRLLEYELLINGIIAFFIFSATASSLYLVNDILDIDNDKLHEYKKNRPIASGELSIPLAILTIITLILLSYTFSFFILPAEFLYTLTIYIALSLLYSFILKYITVIDILVLSILYTLRLYAGASAMSLEVTFWITSFSLFIFFSLAVLKRYTELVKYSNDNTFNNSSRPYKSLDISVLSSFGTSSGFISVLILALYINEQDNGEMYKHPEWMWIAIPLLLLWISRVWIKVHRKQMHDDPIIFAIKDNPSRIIGLFFVLSFWLAA
tara:strand:- start:334 stop:1206 length:873 start_codon:yes stop_codon:yes gene_type:complete